MARRHGAGEATRRERGGRTVWQHGAGAATAGTRERVAATTMSIARWLSGDGAGHSTKMGMLVGEGKYGSPPHLL
jgi:hypothetical protein